MSKKQKTGQLSLELVGGVFITEKFKDGTERREEIDGATILKLLVVAISEGIELTLAKEQAKGP